MFGPVPPEFAAPPGDAGVPSTRYPIVHGCLLGGAIGDALGAPVECEERTAPEQLHQQHVRVLRRQRPAHPGLGERPDLSRHGRCQPRLQRPEGSHPGLGNLVPDNGSRPLSL
ncbi:ADP-ribosylglycohydrolase family protein [Nocardia sp. NEAU-G5]|uniref:ADP-ribosylglycohydrolase family protein n=1 Tax=Nocardia albiluteola TaxID=2842303 RepID=A0ABS6AZD9_9NOCA|nr:ADP-ribosylglycohydrolase family protein [Nocardia albiluteola]